MALKTYKDGNIRVNKNNHVCFLKLWIAIIDPINLLYYNLFSVENGSDQICPHQPHNQWPSVASPSNDQITTCGKIPPHAWSQGNINQW